MAISSDLGSPENVHPPDKKPVGERLARLALHFTYGRKNIVPYGPAPVNAIKQKASIVIAFRYGHQLTTGDGRPLRGFKLVDEKGIEEQPQASIRNGKVIITID